MKSTPFGIALLMAVCGALILPVPAVALGGGGGGTGTTSGTGTSGGSGEPTVGADIIPPDPTTLVPGDVGASTVVFRWTATGDDGSVGVADHYDLRYSTVVDAFDFESATEVMGEPLPAAPGTTEMMTVTGLAPGMDHFFAIKVIDEAGNASPMSGVVLVTTLSSGDLTPPTAIDDLESTQTTVSGVTLRWSAPGDEPDGDIVAAYILSVMSGGSPVPASVTLPEPAAPGTTQNAAILGLLPGTEYTFVLKSKDAAGNTSLPSNEVIATTLAENPSGGTPPAENPSGTPGGGGNNPGESSDETSGGSRRRCSAGSQGSGMGLTVVMILIAIGVCRR